MEVFRQLQMYLADKSIYAWREIKKIRKFDIHKS